MAKKKSVKKAPKKKGAKKKAAKKRVVKKAAKKKRPVNKAINRAKKKSAKAAPKRKPTKKKGVAKKKPAKKSTPKKVAAKKKAVARRRATKPVAVEAPPLTPVQTAPLPVETVAEVVVFAVEVSQSQSVLIGEPLTGGGSEDSSPLLTSSLTPGDLLDMVEEALEESPQASEPNAPATQP